MAGDGEPMPQRLEPMLARVAERPPRGDGWAFEVKWDGVRAISFLDSEPRICSRRGEDVTRRYPELAGLAEALGGQRAVLDGEIVCLDDDGAPSFQRLQRRMGLTSEAQSRRRSATEPVTLVAFDLLHLEGRSLLGEPYAERRRLLAALELQGPHWRTPDHHVGDGAALLAVARERGLEGLVAKRLASPYRPGTRSRDWLKLPLRRRAELVIAGWHPGEGVRAGRIGSLAVGYWDSTPEEASRLGRGQLLVYAGGVGAGLGEAALEELRRRLEPLRRETSPFGAGTPQRQTVFCEPVLVCDVAFNRWTREGTLRAPSFKGLREDRDPREVVREP
jgi:bifunctional non-homologous end joining protein LigD